MCIIFIEDMENLASFVCMVPMLHIILFLIWVTEKVQDTILKSDQYVVSTDNVQGQISEHIFAAKLRLSCVYYPSVLKIGEYPQIFPNGIFAHVTRLDQSRASENICWIINIYYYYYYYIYIGTENVGGQISEHIFAPNEAYCLYIYIYIYICNQE